MRIAIAYAATALCFLALDLVWLGAMAERFYRPRMGGLLLAQPDLAAAGLFYLAYVAGLQVFAVWPALRAGGWARGLGLGAMLGAFAYATYDLTNLATLRGFPALVAVVDIAWGACATGAACALAVAITRRLAGGRPQ